MNRSSDRSRNLLRVFPVLAALLISGCAELNSIYRSQSLPDDKPYVVSVDAKQRVVLSSPVASDESTSTETRTSSTPSSAGGQTTTTVTNTKTPSKTITRFCAEPPPDVFTALASSLGAEASLSKSATPEVAAKLAVTMSENAATIERTQTVNILREAMYRNCERYLSGAISEEEFIVQAARDQQLIVQVLAVEQITGVARAQSTALTTVAKAAAGGVSDASLSILSEAKKDVDAKRAASEKAAADAAALPPPGTCGASPVDETNLPSGVTAEQAKAKNAKCADAKTAAKLSTEAEDYFALVEQAVARQGAVSSETQGKLASAAQTASEASTEIAGKVVEIVKLYQAFDEIGMTCVVKLRKDKEPPEYCKKLLDQIAKTREAELALKMQEASLRQAQLGLEETRLNAARVNTLRLEMESTTQSEAELVWEQLGRSVTSENLKALTDKAGIPLADAHRKRLENAQSDFQAFAKAFKKLPSEQQAALAKASGSP